MTRTVKKMVALLLAGVLVCGLLAGCTAGREGTATTNETPEVGDTPELDGTPIVGSRPPTVGISLPNNEDPRWEEEAGIMEAQLKAAGFDVVVRYAENDTNEQNNQLMQMVSECDLLIIAPVDGNSLSTTLYEAEEVAQIPVIAYETLIMNTYAVSYGIMFNPYDLGRQIFEYVRDQLNLDSTDGPYTIELASGAPDENTERLFDGVMDYFSPYIHDGNVIIKSHRTEYEQVAASDAEEVRNRMRNILTDYYSDGNGPDAIICTDDAVAREVRAVLDERDTGKRPIITGMGCDLETAAAIYGGEQSMSLYRDTSEMARRTAVIAIALMNGDEVSGHTADEDLRVNDEASYDNGNKLVPMFLQEAVVISHGNMDYIFDNGIYTRDDLTSAD